MTIILVGAQKGGVGKSTIAASIAVELAHSGQDVCIVDADKQQSLSKWHQYRSELEDLPTVNCVSATGNIATTLKDLNQRYGVLVVDVAGRDSIEMRSAMVVADILISPFRPSQADLDTIPHLLEMFEQAKVMNPGLNGFLVQNMCPTLPSLKDADKAAELLEGTELMELANVRLCDRKGHRDGFGYGYGVKEWKEKTNSKSDEKAASEINWLISEVLKMRKPTSNNKLSENFINGAENVEVLKRGRPKSGVKTKPVTISCTKDDLEAMEDVIEFALNIKDTEGKRVKLNQSEAVRLGFEAVKVIAKDSPEMFEVLLRIVKSGR